MLFRLRKVLWVETAEHRVLFHAPVKRVYERIKWRITADGFVNLRRPIFHRGHLYPAIKEFIPIFFNLKRPFDRDNV